MWLIIVTVTGFVLLYMTTIKPLRHWKKKGIPYVTPLPFLGNMTPIALKKQAFPHFIEDLYNKYRDHRYVGFYEWSTPVLMLRDPQLIKQICVKDFNSFPERQAFLPKDVDPFWSRNIMELSGENWRNMRSLLSPAFTSSKMKSMFGLVKECSKRFVDHYLRKSELVVVEAKDIFSRFTNDVMASTIFGVTCDSLEKGDNEFYLTIKQASNFWGNKLKLYGFTVCPTLMKLLKVRFFEEKVEQFIQNIVTETMEVREKYGITRPDMIHLLTQVRSGQLRHEDPSTGLQKSSIGTERQHLTITTKDIAAQALIFFLGGFDTSSTLISYLTYELAVNPDIQNRLKQEIDRTLENGNGDVDGEALLGMKYLDMVVTETLRKWPPSSYVTRTCTKHFTIEPEKNYEKPLHMEPGTICWIPVYALHRDPTYFPDPERFDPDRFGEHGGRKAERSAFLPFGLGPRNCIGIRLALMKVKTALFYLLFRFEIVPVEKTEVPLTLNKNGRNMMTSKGIWLGLKPRIE